MKATPIVIIAVFLALAILHQDAWNWDNSNLVFGLLPVGLAYHAAYSITAAVFWALVIKFAWPSALEAWANESEGGEKPHEKS